MTVPKKNSCWQTGSRVSCCFKSLQDVAFMEKKGGGHMLIKNGNILTETWQFEQLDLLIAGDTIAEIAPTGSIQVECDQKETEYDAAGLYVVPGLVDIHIHGCDGYDFCDAEEE